MSNCDYCVRYICEIDGLKVELDHKERRIAELEEAAQKCVDETVGVIGCDALEELAKLLEGE